MLDIADASRNGGLRKPHPSTSRSQATRLCDSKHIPELVQFHLRSPDGVYTIFFDARQASLMGFPASLNAWHTIMAGKCRKGSGSGGTIRSVGSQLEACHYSGPAAINETDACRGVLPTAFHAKRKWEPMACSVSHIST